MFADSKSSQRAIDELQRTIVDIETKYKAEIGRLKKKYETDIREFEIQIDALSRNNAELAKANKSLSNRVKVMAVSDFFSFRFIRVPSSAARRALRRCEVRIREFNVVKASWPKRWTSASTVTAKVVGATEIIGAGFHFFEYN
jgi:hypothetical protein